MMRMDRNTAIAAAAVVALIVIVFYMATLPPADSPGAGTGADEYAPPFGLEDVGTMDEFELNLLLAQKVCLVEDLRGLEAYPFSRNNIMQCGIDLAGSPGLAGKQVSVYVFEAGVCTSGDGEKTMDECYSEILSADSDPESAIIWIEKGDLPNIYARALLVRINEEYSQGACRVERIVPGGDEPEPAANETAAPSNSSAQEELPSGANESEAGAGEGIAANDSITFP